MLMHGRGSASVLNKKRAASGSRVGELGHFIAGIQDVLSHEAQRERRKGRWKEKDRQTGLGDSVLPKQHSQKRCGSDVRACVTSTL